jgi:F420H(2)-dependent biliverdin reductase
MGASSPARAAVASDLRPDCAGAWPCCGERSGLWHPERVSLDPHDLPADVLAFLRERHLATLTTLRPDGSPHVVPVGFTWDDEATVVRVITSGPSRKARNALAGGRAVVAQVDGRRWLALEGPVRVLTDAPSVREAEERYAARYRTPRENPARVVLQISVDRVLGSA